MHYSTLLMSVTVAVAAGQTFDLGMIDSAPLPTASGPDATAVAETVTYNAAASGSAAVTGTAAAIATNAKRANVEARTFSSSSNLLCSWFGIGCPASTTTKAAVATPTACSTSTSTSKPATSTTCTTTKSTVKAAATTATMITVTSSSSSSTSSLATITSFDTSIPTPTGIPSTCTNTWTNTNAFTSATDCPTLFEVGTYCGFKNPEDPCQEQPAGSGPVASPDTVDAFYNSPANKATSLNAKTPSGYALTFQGLQGSTSAVSYLGLTTLTSYDVAGCAAACDAKDTCTSFNVYIERDPALQPSTTYCCPNPASLTNYKCTLWGSIIDNTTATNTGEGREEFQVVITGSNGYTKANTTAPATPAGCSNPKKCSGTHSHKDTCIGKHFFPGPYNPQLCASYAQAQNIKNGASIGRGYSNNHCNFFNAYMLKKNGSPQGTYCSLFAKQYDSTDATYTPGWVGNDYYGFETSWSFEL